MWDKTPTEEDAPMGSSLTRSSRKATHEANNSIRCLVDEGFRNKSSRQHGVHKRQAVDSPQFLEPSTSDPTYVPGSEPESSGTDYFVTCLEGGEEVVPTTADDTTCLQETDRAPPTRAKVKKMCKKLSRSMAMRSGVMVAPLKRNPKSWKAGIKENYS